MSRAMDKLAQGLSAPEAAARLAAEGPNRIQEALRRTPWPILLEQFRSPLVLLLLAACGVSFALGERAEAIAIFGILALNSLIGFLQEYRAENAIHALRQMTAPRARVLREGRQLVVPAETLVRGDLLLLEAGDIVAADARLREASRLEVNEAVLTGESLPVAKAAGGSKQGPIAERDGVVFMGTAVSAGTALAEVTNTGMKTELGRIAHLVQSAMSPLTPLQVQLQALGRMILFVCLAAAAFVLAAGLLEGKPVSEILVFAISLAVAAVPEGMPAIVTVALALGVQRMAARNAIVRSLPSVETLSSVTVICTDKTGTLTTGNMRVRELWGEDHHALLQTAASCCDAELDPEGTGGTGDPTELAILLAARERGIEKAELEEKNPRLHTEPFDSLRKRMSIGRSNGVLYVKGAMESVLALCEQSPETLAAARRAGEDLTECGLRVLAVATGSGREEKGLRLTGLLGLADPPRTEVAQAIREARAAGIRPVMITGDHPATAAAIARELGLVLEGEELKGRVHARATPEEKLLLVREWKARGAVVAMTGDGVNDAPALREAHIGIAMGRAGTEVTRQSADLILADDNFATIVAAVKEGRVVYQNVRKAILYLLTGNCAELLVVLATSLLGLPLPFGAAHLLWINLVTDSLPGLALIADPAPSNLMSRPPRPPAERLIGPPEWKRLGLTALLEAAVIVALYAWLLRGHSHGEARSVAFTTFVFSQLFRAFGARSRTRIFWQVGALSNLWLLGIVVITSALQASLHYVPLAQEMFGLVPFTLEQLYLALPASLITITAVELTKLLPKKQEALNQP